MTDGRHLTHPDRLAIRERPNGRPLMHQTWGRLLFMHWRIDEKLLRPMIPAPLEIDTFDGTAWIGVIPFTMWDIRATFLPPIPSASAFHELNVRTYVHYQGVPGVWFFSLDAAHRLAVCGARAFYHLPYFNAEMSLKQSGDRIDYSSARRDPMSYPKFFAAEQNGFGMDFNAAQVRDLPRAQFKGSWRVDEALTESRPGSLEFFLTERYCLYAYRRGFLSRARIFHDPWPLRSATIDSFQSTMIESLGLPSPKGEPVLNYAEEIDVDIWPVRRL